MENIRVNSCENLDKRGILQTQQIEDYGESYDEFVKMLSEKDKKRYIDILKLKDDMIATLWGEVTELLIENDNLIELHNIKELNFSKERNSEDNPFLANQVENYSLDDCAKAYEEANNVII